MIQTQETNSIPMYRQHILCGRFAVGNGQILMLPGPRDQVVVEKSLH